MYKPGSAVIRKKTKITIWIQGGIIIEGFTHLPEGSRESDYFEAKTRTTTALTECLIKYPDGKEQQADTLIINKHQVLFFQPLD